MKIQQESGFTPITITLETEDVARTLKTIMNYSANIRHAGYTGGVVSKCEEFAHKIHSGLGRHNIYIF